MEEPKVVASQDDPSEHGELLRLEIVTPQRSVFSGYVESFWAPGTSGGFQILHGHAPFLTTITIGEIKLRDGYGAESSYATSGGFVEVSNNNITFLADTLEGKDEIDVSRAMAAKARAEERLRKSQRRADESTVQKTPTTGKEEKIDVARARAALSRAINRLRITGALQGTAAKG